MKFKYKKYQKYKIKILIDCIDRCLSLKITRIITRIIAVRFDGDGFSARLERRARKKRVKYPIPTETESRERSFVRIIILSARVSHHTAIWRVHYLLAKLAHRR